MGVDLTLPLVILRDSAAQNIDSLNNKPTESIKLAYSEVPAGIKVQLEGRLREIKRKEKYYYLLGPTSSVEKIKYNCFFGRTHMQMLHVLSRSFLIHWCALVLNLCLDDVDPVQYLTVGAPGMYYYSIFNPLDMPSMVWTFLHPANQSLSNLETHSPPSCSSAAGQLSQVSHSQETLDTVSPTHRVPDIYATNSFSSNSLKNSCFKTKKEKSLIQEEQEYHPNAPEVKRTRRTPQNANRNVVPNIMHQVISFLQKKNKSMKLVERLIKKLGVEEVCSPQRFYNYQKLIKGKLNNYVNAESLTLLKELQEPDAQIYGIDEQTHYNKISRLLVVYFLKRQYDSIILTSVRVSSDKKLDHLMMKRRILEQISDMLRTD